MSKKAKDKFLSDLKEHMNDPIEHLVPKDLAIAYTKGFEDCVSMSEDCNADEMKEIATALREAFEKMYA